MQVEMAPSALRLQFPASFEAIRDNLAEMRRSSWSRDLTREEAGTVELVLSEVLNNIAEHACAGRTDGEIRLVQHPVATGLIFRIADNGVAMPALRLPDGRAPDVDVREVDMPEGGFGWFLIHELARDLSYQRRDGLNQLQFRIAVGQRTATGA